MRKKIALAAAVILVLFLGLVASGVPFTPKGETANKSREEEEPATFYVSTTGGDAGNGSLQAPWRTVQHALDALQPGQTVYVRGGVYNEYVEFRRSGAPGAPITLSGFPGESAVLDGAGLNWRYGVNLEGFDFLVVQNLTVRDYVRDGVRGFGVVGWGDTDDLTLRDLNVSLVGVPIKVAAEANPEVCSRILITGIVASRYEGGGVDLGPGTVSDVVISDVSLSGPLGANDTAADGVAVENGTNVLVEGVVLTGHLGDAVDLKADNATVRRVDARGYGRNGLKLWGANSLAENCLFVGGGLEALVLKGRGPYVIRHCTFSTTPGHGYTAVVGPYEPEEGAPVSVTLQGNIFYTTQNTGTLVYFSPAISLQSDHNLYYSPQRADAVLVAHPGGVEATFSETDINDGAWTAAMGVDRESRYADPLFVDAGTGDYQLREGSPARERVPARLAPAVDLLGRPRPQGRAAEIGPYEASTP